jgi:hypothetical protein
MSAQVGRFEEKFLATCRAVSDERNACWCSDKTDDSGMGVKFHYCFW